MAHKKSEDQVRARELYQQQGKNYKEIVAILGVAKSSVSLWCSDLARERRAAKTMSRVKAARRVREVKAKRERIGVTGLSPYEDYDLYTYASKDGITRVQLVHRETKHKLSMALARYRMSVHLGRFLDRDEMVVHRDLKNLSEEVEDLLVVPRNALKGKRPHPTKECVICETEFQPLKASVETCSRPCRSALVSMILIDRHRESMQA